MEPQIVKSIKNFCTVSDYEFLPQGLSLFDSMVRFDKEFILYYLCLDLQTYMVLEELVKLDKYKNIIPITLSQISIQDPDYTHLLALEPSAEAINVGNRTRKNPKEIEKIWAMSAYFTHYCAESLGCQNITYVDADIFFFDTWRNIFEATIDNQSVGLVRHKIAYNPDVGEFNVGIVYFNTSLEEGFKLLKFWKDCVLKITEEPIPEEYSKCGDQKYLELLYERGEHVYALDDTSLGHAAPWNFRFQYFSNENGKVNVMYYKEEHPLTYVHFSNFKPTIESYVPAPRHGVIKVDGIIKILYDEYFYFYKKNLKLTLDNMKGLLFANG